MDLRVIWPVVLDLVNPLSVSEGCFFSARDTENFLTGA